MKTYDTKTSSSTKYTFFPILCGSLKFRVKAKSNAHLALTSGPSEDHPLYEIIIGGWENTKSVLRRDRKSPDKATASTPSILSEEKPKEFWITWSNGSIMVGSVGDSKPFLMYYDPDPFPVSYYAVRTGWGATGEWLIEGGRSIATVNDLKYHFNPLPKGSLMFDVQCPSNAHLVLASAKNPEEYEKSPRIEIIIGGWENTQSALRRDGANLCVVTSSTPGVVSASEPRRFKLHWRNGSVILHPGSMIADPILEYHSPEHVAVTYLGVRTSYGATGEWKITEGDSPQHPGDGEGVHDLVWKDASNGKIPQEVFAGGHNGQYIQYIGRALYNGSLLPGKVTTRNFKCYIAWNDKLHSTDEYQVLCGNNFQWIVTSGSNIPCDAAVGGYTEDGETLYIGRVHIDGTATVGKVQRSKGLCFIRHLGIQRTFDTYEILVVKSH